MAGNKFSPTKAAKQPSKGGPRGGKTMDARTPKGAAPRSYTTAPAAKKGNLTARGTPKVTGKLG